MLTKSEVAAHERKIWRILVWEAVSIAIAVLGFALGDPGIGSPLVLIGVLAFIVGQIRGYAYMLQDLRLRGKSPIWGLFSFGFLMWLYWRKRHPIPTKDNPYGRVR